MRELCSSVNVTIGGVVFTFEYLRASMEYGGHYFTCPTRLTKNPVLDALGEPLQVQSFFWNGERQLLRLLEPAIDQARAAMAERGNQTPKALEDPPLPTRHYGEELVIHREGKELVFKREGITRRSGRHDLVTYFCPGLTSERPRSPYNANLKIGRTWFHILTGRMGTSLIVDGEELAKALDQSYADSVAKRDPKEGHPGDEFPVSRLGRIPSYHPSHSLTFYCDNE